MESTSTDLDTMSHHQATRACQPRVLVSERKEYWSQPKGESNL